MLKLSNKLAMMIKRNVERTVFMASLLYDSRAAKVEQFFYSTNRARGSIWLDSWQRFACQRNPQPVVYPFLMPIRRTGYVPSCSAANASIPRTAIR